MVEEQLNLLTIQRIPLEVYAEKLIEKGCFRYSDTDPKERVSWRRYYTLERLVVGKTSIDNKQIEMSDLIKPVEYKGSNSEKNIFKRAFAKIKVADINVDHNQALFVLEKAFENSVSPKIVVNFDTHSDMYIRCGKKNTIANWVNFTFSHKDIDKCYWVVPKKIIQDNPYAAYNYFFAAYNESGAVIGNYDYTKICAPGEMYSQKFYYEYKNNCLTPIIDKKPKGRVKEVELVVCTEDNLPKFKDNDEIFLSVDGDYFCNCGRDTVAQFLNFPYDINESFKSFGKIIEKCNIKPNSFSMSISPDYTSIFGSREVYGYFKYLLSFTSQKWIPIKEYKFDNKPSCLKDSSKSECDNEQDDLLDMI